ncbi:hypothetical protein RKD39_006587 [Streptomyces albogriseolus]
MGQRRGEQVVRVEEAVLNLLEVLQPYVLRVVGQPAGVLEQVPDGDLPGVDALAAHESGEVPLDGRVQRGLALRDQLQHHDGGEGLGVAARPHLPVVRDRRPAVEPRRPRDQRGGTAVLAGPGERGRELLLRHQPVEASLEGRARGRVRLRGARDRGAQQARGRDDEQTSAQDGLLVPWHRHSFSVGRHRKRCRCRHREVSRAGPRIAVPPALPRRTRPGPGRQEGPRCCSWVPVAAGGPVRVQPASRSRARFDGEPSSQV